MGNVGCWQVGERRHGGNFGVESWELREKKLAGGSRNRKQDLGSRMNRHSLLNLVDGKLKNTNRLCTFKTQPFKKKWCAHPLTPPPKNIKKIRRFPLVLVNRNGCYHRSHECQPHEGKGAQSESERIGACAPRQRRVVWLGGAHRNHITPASDTRGAPTNVRKPNVGGFRARMAGP